MTRSPSLMSDTVSNVNPLRPTPALATLAHRPERLAAPEGRRAATSRARQGAPAMALRLLQVFVLSACLAASAAWAAPGKRPLPFVDRPEVAAFLDELVQGHGFSRTALQSLFAAIEPDPRVLALIDPPPRKLAQVSWPIYRSRFVNRNRIEAGLHFWAEHEAAVARASAHYGIPPEIIVGIIGVETIYGRYTGSFPTAATLATLAFQFPRRADFFRRELEQFLLYTRETGVDPLGIRGSYAGAMGLPQFMPSSLRAYAVDFDGDGRVDLAGSADDAIGSVASFLASHGWERDAPIRVGLQLDADARLDPLRAAGIEPRFDVAALREHGVHVSEAVDAARHFALIELPAGEAGTERTLGTRNFYVLTRYNRSSLYASAVIELGAAIRAARAQAPS